MNKSKKADTLRDTDWYILEIGGDFPPLVSPKITQRKPKERKGVRHDGEGFTIIDI